VHSILGRRATCGTSASSAEISKHDDHVPTLPKSENKTHHQSAFSFHLIHRRPTTFSVLELSNMSVHQQTICIEHQLLQVTCGAKKTAVQATTSTSMWSPQDATPCTHVRVCVCIHYFMSYTTTWILIKHMACILVCITTFNKYMCCVYYT